MPITKIWLSWSSGKDSAWAIHELRNAGSFEVTGLITTINRDAGRVAMHAVRQELVEAQAQALGVPLVKIPIPAQCSNAVYDSAMESAMAEARTAGVQHIAFGDLFLEDIRRYREERLQSVGMTPVFPLWARPTAALAREMIDGGLRAYLTCVDPKQLPAWLKPEDLVQLCRIGLDHPDIHFEIFYGASNNERGWWDNHRAIDLGYRPTGRAEDFREHAFAEQAKLKPDPVGDFYQGGTFCGMEFDGDNSRIVDELKY